MFMFNEAISSLGLVELPLHGRKFTWRNKQQDPVLEQLDWFFKSSSRIISYPNIVSSTMVMETSDHVPCVIKIDIIIPSARIFRFENYWMQHPDFMAIVQHSNWSE